MRIACFQGPEHPDTPQGNVGRLERLASEARSADADLLIAPELFLTGYAIGKGAIERLAEPLDGPSLISARRIAKERSIALCFGFPERDGGKVYNTAVVVGADGNVLTTYRKTHLFGDVDREQFADSKTAPAIIEIAGFKIGLLICYDVEFPENVRIHALNGADVVVVPTALMRPFDVVAKTIVPARACENQIFIAYVNRCGSEASFDYCGLSCVVGPDGDDLARAGRREELIFANLDRRALDESRRINTYLADRRPGLYGRLSQRDEKK